MNMDIPECEGREDKGGQIENRQKENNDDRARNHRANTRTKTVKNVNVIIIHVI